MSLLFHPENQQLIWEIINNNPFAVQFFQANTHIKKEQWFKTTMEHFYNLYKGRTIDKNELNHVNKEVLTYMIQNIHTMAQTNVMMQRQNEMTPASYSSIPTPPIPENNREELYKQQFMQKQQEYKSLFDKQLPPEIDFREKEKDTAISNMDELIKKQVQERNSYLNIHPAPSANLQPVTTNDNIQLVREEPTNKKSANLSETNDQNNSKILELMNEHKNEIASLKNIILELSRQVVMTNERLNMLTKPDIKPQNMSLIQQQTNMDVFVETVENDN
jgi:hypothetical protein